MDFGEIWSMNQSIVLFVYGHVAQAVCYASVQFDLSKRHKTDDREKIWFWSEVTLTYSWIAASARVAPAQDQFSSQLSDMCRSNVILECIPWSLYLLG
jgi:hypothetical protein